METKPSVLIVSSSNIKPQSLIKLITKCKQFEAETNSYFKTIWNLDTKYYTAEINVIGITEQYERSDGFNQNVEALIIHMDTNKNTGLDDIKIWSKLENECTPEVKLLITNYCTNETKITKSKALEWCLKNGYELIELYPSKNNTDQLEEENNDLMTEKVGVERIIEALEAHVWPNLKMKDKQNNVNEQEQKLAEFCDDFLTTEGLDDFNDLFSQLSVMKSSIQSLPINQRKQCAEQMVTAFWKAIGGEEEEIADI